MIFKDPWILFFIPIILAGVYILKRRQHNVSIRFPSKTIVNSLSSSWKVRCRQLPLLMRYAVLILFLIALAGPRAVLEETVTQSEGIDIVLAIDASGSMAAEDFKVDGQRKNRLTVVKEVVADFIKQRKTDQIGLIAFAGLAHTVCPLTTDYSWLNANLERIDLGIIQDGTAIGSAMASSVGRLKQSKAKSRVVILLTDGINNAGDIDPLMAARTAETFGIKIYTIGAGAKGYAPYPAQDFFGRKVYQNVRVDIDEKTLKEIAEMTNGKYFRATDTESLKAIYKEIDALEKTEIEQIGYMEHEELFDKVLLVALLFLVFEIILTNTVLLKIP